MAEAQSKKFEYQRRKPEEGVLYKTVAAQLETFLAARQAEREAHLLENILPWIAYRQYVVTVPVAMRFWLARSPKLMTRVRGIITSVIRRRLRVQAKAEEIELVGSGCPRSAFRIYSLFMDWRPACLSAYLTRCYLIGFLYFGQEAPEKARR